MVNNNECMMCTALMFMLRNFMFKKNNNEHNASGIIVHVSSLILHQLHSLVEVQNDFLQQLMQQSQ